MSSQKHSRRRAKSSYTEPSRVVSEIEFKPERADGTLTYEIYIDEQFVGIYYPKCGSTGNTTWLTPSSSEAVLTKVIKEALYDRFGPEAAKDIVVED